jgi:general secretion pathway protein M
MIAKRAIAIGALAVLLLGAAISVYAVAAASKQATEEALDRLSAYQSAIATRPQLEAQLERLRQQSGSLIGLVPGASAPLAAASIQNDVRTMALQVGGELRSTQNLPPSRVESFEKIEVHCDATVPMNRLKDLLYEIEAHTPYLFLDRLSMEVPQDVSPRPDSMQLRVDIQFVVRGYRWVGP